jgi:hypothetical protein
MIAFMVVQAVVSTGEIYYVGFLGSDALAGVAVSYPLLMLMTTMSGGGMGARWLPRSPGHSVRGGPTTPVGWSFTPC